VPDHEPYEHLTTVNIEPAGDGVHVVMTIDPLHDEAWTKEYLAHRGVELDNLEAAIHGAFIKIRQTGSVTPPGKRAN
jgi:hypothetical protein